MAQVIGLRDALRRCTEERTHSPGDGVRSEHTTALSSVDRHLPMAEDIDRAIVLLDTVAEQARLLAKQAHDPSCSEYVEQQTENIVKLLGVALGMTTRRE